MYSASGISQPAVSVIQHPLASWRERRSWSFHFDQLSFPDIWEDTHMKACCISSLTFQHREAPPFFCPGLQFHTSSFDAGAYINSYSICLCLCKTSHTQISSFCHSWRQKYIILYFGVATYILLLSCAYVLNSPDYNRYFNFAWFYPMIRSPKYHFFCIRVSLSSFTEIVAIIHLEKVTKRSTMDSELHDFWLRMGNSYLCKGSCLHWYVDESDQMPWWTPVCGTILPNTTLSERGSPGS